MTGSGPPFPYEPLFFLTQWDIAGVVELPELSAELPFFLDFSISLVHGAKLSGRAILLVAHSTRTVTDWQAISHRSLFLAGGHRWA